MTEKKFLSEIEQSLKEGDSPHLCAKRALAIAKESGAKFDHEMCELPKLKRAHKMILLVNPRKLEGYSSSTAIPTDEQYDEIIRRCEVVEALLDLMNKGESFLDRIWFRRVLKGEEQI